jgi:heat shock protein HtpX
VAVVAAAGSAAGLVVALPVALLLGLIAGLLAFLVVAIAVAVGCWMAAGSVVLRLAGGAAPSLAEVGPARLANLVESVAVAVGVPEPALRIVADPAPNALVTGRDSRRATLVVTSGLLERLDRLALEAVVAQQLSIIRTGSTHRRDVTVAVLGTAGHVVPPLGRLAADAAAVERGADIAAVGVTRYPPGLLGALEAVAAGPEVRTSPVLAPLWFAPPGSAGDLALRLETMRELV